MCTHAVRVPRDTVYKIKLSINMLVLSGGSLGQHHMSLTVVGKVDVRLDPTTPSTEIVDQTDRDENITEGTKGLRD